MGLMLPLLTGIVVFCVYLLIDNVLANKKRTAATQMAADGSILEQTHYSDHSLNVSGEPSGLARFMLALVGSIGVNTEDSARDLTLRFARAGAASPNAPAFYLFMQTFGAGFFLVLAYILYTQAGEDNQIELTLAALIIAALGLLGPKLYLKNLIDKRKQKLQRAFPDTLDLLLICVESGLALDAALNRVCGELGNVYPEMAAELNRTRLELSLLNDRVRALMNLAERTDMVAFRSLVSSLIQSERFGTALTDTLRVLSDEFRVQRLTDAEVKAARLPVLITIPLIFLLMPAFFLIIMGPAIVSFSNDGQEVTGKK